MNSDRVLDCMAIPRSTRADDVYAGSKRIPVSLKLMMFMTILERA